MEKDRIEQGSKLHGFTVDRVRHVEELQGTLLEMTHDKTGAQLCWLDNGAQNKLFCVGFKTLPEDSTGVFHILEHSVLCGSEKYPVKEPFVDMLKGSMNTFLNAMTYPDKTIYPVSSCNKQDFLNLTSVYLDAVFAPRLLENPNIFYQEGIHTETLDEEGPCYRGVVFNEMKGAMSGVDDRIEQGMNSLLFPDTCYRFNSGGDPTVIPDLTYEQFVDTYKRFYHPSNARFFLDGSVPLEETLPMISSYLERYERSDRAFHLTAQAPVSLESTEYYEIGEEEEEPQNKAVLSMGKVIGLWSDRQKVLAAHILCDVLADSNEAPLKRAMLSSGLLENFEMVVIDGIYQPYLLLVARNLADKDSQAVRETIHNTARKLAASGLDKAALAASINRFAFRAKQVSEPQGLYHATAAYQSWLYGGDPLTYLVYDDAIAALRRLADGDYFEELLTQLLVETDGLAVLHLLPSVDYGAQQRRAEESRVQAELAAYTPQQRQELDRCNRELADWQCAPDTPEAAATLPILSLKEVAAAPEYTKTVERTEQGVTVLYHPVSSHGIVYLSMFFPLTGFSLEELTRLSVFPELFGKLPTEQYSVAQLQQQIKSLIGSLEFGLAAFAPQHQTTQCTPYLEVSAGMLEENFAAGKALIAEILTKTQFDQPEKIREIVTQAAETARLSAMSSGHSLGLCAVLAQYSAKGAVSEAIGGYSFVKALQQFSRKFDEQVGEFLSLVHRVERECIGRAGLTVSVTASSDVPVADLLSLLPAGQEKPAAMACRTPLPERMGIRIPAQIGFAVQGCHISREAMESMGSLRVAANILSLGYLWSAIRVQGGAYGAGFGARQDGNIFCYSYRDPSPMRSLEIYGEMADFIRDYCADDEALDKYILSAVAGMEGLRTPREEGHLADEFWFSGITEEKRRTLRQQMLATERSALLDWCPVLENMAAKGAICVVGNEETLRTCPELTVFEL